MSYKNQIKTDNEDINMFHVDVLDGVRAIAVLVVVMFLFGSKAWLNAYFTDSGTFIYECFKD